jgi:hypothetical protein
LSAILKALRKIERESSGEIQTPSFSKNLDAKKAIHQRARKAWLLRRLASVFIPVLVLGAIIGLAFAFKPFYFGRNPFFSPVSQVHGEEQKAAGPPAPEQRREYGQAPERAFKAQTAPRENTVSEPSPGSSPVKDRPAASRRSSEAGTTSKGCRNTFPSCRKPLTGGTGSSSSNSRPLCGPMNPHPALP